MFPCQTCVLPEWIGHGLKLAIKLNLDNEKNNGFLRHRYIRTNTATLIYFIVILKKGITQGFKFQVKI